jgi:hypothetical protein
MVFSFYFGTNEGIFIAERSNNNLKQAPRPTKGFLTFLGNCYHLILNFLLEVDFFFKLEKSIINSRA